MKYLVILSISFVLTACAIDYGAKLETKREFAEIKRVLYDAGRGPKDHRLQTIHKCERTWISVADSAKGTDKERYDSGRLAYHECMEKNGY